MHQPDPNPERPELTPLQRDRLDFARRDLGNARATDLSELPPAGLILLLSTVTRRLDDCLSVFDELYGDTSPGSSRPSE
jgi:hypothetical protein